MKAADISDAIMLEAVAAEMTGIGASIWEVAKHFPDVPFKVVRAKLDKLVRRKILNGCCCGCRGDFTIKERPI